MKALVTGGTGFIGSYIVVELLEAGHEITILARNPSKVSTFTQDERIRFIKGDLSEHAILRDAVRGMDAVIHVALGWGDEAETMLLNDTLPSIILMEAAKNAGVQHFIYTSSTACHGEMRKLMGPDSKTRPTDFYGATKASTENFLIALSHQSEMRCNIIRPGYTFGNPVVPGASIYSDTRFKDIARNAARGLPIEVTQHDGTQFIWAGDLAKIYRSVLESDCNREIYQGLASVFTSWEDVARQAIELTGSSSEIRTINQGYDAEPNLWCVAKIQEHFGYAFNGEPKIPAHLQHFVDQLPTS
ncbi:NAD dependent epimerase/dehydratase family [Verrucomicrobiia bacterium DG1235]|nr:NAD dependent epimerase/dehydratase family [Verrucomicrobiae bacterium DG1235]